MNQFVRRLMLAMLFGVLVYGGFAVYTGLSKIRASLADYEFATFGVALALASGNYLVRFLKWQYYLRRLEVRGIGTLDSFLIFLSGFVLTITPGKVGEVFKSAVLFKTHGVPIARTGPIVVAERLTDAVGVIVLIVLGSAAFAGGLGWAIAGILAVSLGLVLIVWDKPMHWMLAWMERRGGALGRLVPRFREAYSSLRIVAGPAALLVPTLLSVLAWSAEGVGFYGILRGFGQAVPLERAVFFYATATLAGALVPMPGGLGVVEGLLQQQLVHLNHVAEGPATASMMLIRFATLWWAVLVGFGALGILRLRFPRELQGATALADAKDAH